MRRFVAGDRVQIDPTQALPLSLREHLREHGELAGTVESVGAPNFAPKYPYCVKLDHADERYRWCSASELTWRYAS